MGYPVTKTIRTESNATQEIKNDSELLLNQLPKCYRSDQYDVL